MPLIDFFLTYLLDLLPNGKRTIGKFSEIYKISLKFSKYLSNLTNFSETYHKLLKFS